jgi:hypothetical protein
MSLLISLVYAVSAVIAAALMFRRPTVLMLIMFVFAAGLALEEQEWFFPVFFESAVDWPARNFTQWFALAIRGISDPTTLPELTLVASGRLLILLGALYGAYFGVRHWPAIVAYITHMPHLRLGLLLGWEACLLVAFVLATAAPGALGLIGVVKFVGALICLGYMGYEAKVEQRRV